MKRGQKMSKGLIKKVMGVVALALLSTSLFVGCGSKEKPVAEPVVNEEVAEKTEEEPKVEEQKEEEKEKEAEKEAETEASKSEDSTATTEGSGQFYAEAMPMFEELYAADEQKDFKLEFAKTALNNMDQVVQYLPQNLQGELFTSRGLVEFEGPTYTYNFQASTQLDNPSKTDNFDGLFGEVNFVDDKEYLYCDSQINVSFALGSDTELVLSEEAKQIIKVLIPEYAPEEIEKLINESLANDGETNYLVEEKNYNVTISSSIYEGNTTASIHVETRKDYP